MSDTSTQDRIDRHLLMIRRHNDQIEMRDREIADHVAARNQEKQAKAELEGRVAFLEGRKKSRNPHQAPLSRSWNIGYDDERRETVDSLHD
jgi:hypothetical protein